MSKEELAEQKETIGQLKLIDKIVIGLILVAVYSFFGFIFFHAGHTDSFLGKPKVVIAK